MIEWTATVLTLVGVILNIKRIRVCFIIWLVGNCLWFYMFITTQVWGMAICQAVFCATCVWGWHEWRPRAAEAARQGDE